MTVVYPAIFTQTGDKKDTYLVSIPDLNGATEGYGLADAIGMAKDYIGNALYNKAELPAARTIKDIDVQNSEFAQAGTSFVSLIDVDLEAFRRMEKSRNVRRNITLPEWLDDMATAAKINVSAVAQSALKEKLGVSR
ncbi:type II toxin-antitoxin system HicB family antitoxin [Treponema sp. Marseille-Q4132]|uniref:type II toxin-antitoxin system HicB family antitoxin n=1 Tax=Treponema sp. Marseille-Q4132 TaxID=2766701 RepID=UPI001652B811|nr:type II toxin-antitoxin system HicB family antitoxin [Treponema sp. Marseille-Q4132]QNL97612.1 type II toxin-antitoxin system HicB family antitoxin [Treponema sp. Marseille-Q4132]